MPDQTYVWIAAYESRGYSADGTIVSLDFPDTKTAKANVSTFVVGHLAIQVIAIHYDLSDVMPAKLYMTVPKGFRRNSEILRVLVLHLADLPQSDIGAVHGVHATKPMRTILDLFERRDMPPATLREVLREALRRGLIRRSEIAGVRRRFTGDNSCDVFSEGSRVMESRRYATAAAFRRARPNLE